MKNIICVYLMGERNDNSSNPAIIPYTLKINIVNTHITGDMNLSNTDVARMYLTHTYYMVSDVEFGRSNLKLENFTSVEGLSRGVLKMKQLGEDGREQRIKDNISFILNKVFHKRPMVHRGASSTNQNNGFVVSSHDWVRTGNNEPVLDSNGTQSDYKYEVNVRIRLIEVPIDVAGSGFCKINRLSLVNAVKRLLFVSPVRTIVDEPVRVRIPDYIPAYNPAYNPGYSPTYPKNGGKRGKMGKMGKREKMRKGTEKRNGKGTRGGNGMKRRTTIKKRSPRTRSRTTKRASSKN
jgi:hypothetical protein